jgi:hypothetical protein
MYMYRQHKIMIGKMKGGQGNNRNRELLTKGWAGKRCAGKNSRRVRSFFKGNTNPNSIRV